MAASGVESARDGALEGEGDRERVNLEAVLEMKLDMKCASRWGRELLPDTAMGMGSRGASHREMIVALSFSSLTIRYLNQRLRRTPERLTFPRFHNRRSGTDHGKT